ncbi:MAG: hypothetical protein ACJ0OP_03330 [Thermodesulfobacteriota bacterium]|jgi:hypothetical protein|nr:hypothetical protein [bacterium]|tara:strand:- start:134 stop:307 length:174 start_codon:yes stop_codon:yes gene_type:complete
MIKTFKNLLSKVKEQSVAVPGYKAKKVLKVYLYIAIVGIFLPILYLIFILFYNFKNG